jgi:hypothetical protein
MVGVLELVAAPVAPTGVVAALTGAAVLTEAAVRRR